MTTEITIMLCAFLFLGGFLWSFLFLRQFFYNIVIAFPLIKKMNALQPDLIAVGAKRYTIMSLVVNFLVGGALLFVVIYFLKWYFILSFSVGALIAAIFVLVRMRLTNKDMFDVFVTAYYRFVPDDELRTILYNKDYKKVKARLKAMGIRDTFVPEFKI